MTPSLLTAFEHPEGHQLDLHWHVFPTSLGKGAEDDFWSAAIPLELGAMRTMRFCDGDLLLHVLEHAGHDEEKSRVQWAVDVVMLLRSTPDMSATVRRLAEQAASHDLLPSLRQRVALLATIVDEPRIQLVEQSLHRQRPLRRRLLSERRRGGVSLAAAVRSAVGERLDSGMTTSPAVWAVYVVTGRRALVERTIRRITGPLTKTVRPATAPGVDGWWDLSDAATLDGFCGVGWSFPEPGQGTWSDGPEARLVLPTGGATTLDLELEVLAEYGGPARAVEVRIDGRVLASLEASAEADGLRSVPLQLPRAEQVEVAFVIRRPGRPVDLGLNPDTRQLGVLVQRLRVS